MEDKIQRLIDKMTLEEKVSMIHGNGLFATAGIKRLNIPALKMSDGPMGVRKDYYNDRWEDLNNNDDFVTYFPCYTALAASWNEDIAYEIGDALGAEARGRGKDVILAPGINIIRTPLCGRNFEYMSEDPLLISKIAVPFIKGIQENDVAACVKHFAVNNQETDRLAISVEVDDRALNEIYLPGFKAAVQEGDSFSIMGAYNKFRGTHCSHNDFLLNKVLKKNWEYPGVVISDWGAVKELIPHGVAEDKKEAAEKAIKAGVDIEMMTACYVQHLEKLLKEGSINTVVTRRLCFVTINQLLLEDNMLTYEGTYPTVKSLLNRNYVHHVGPNEL